MIDPISWAYSWPFFATGALIGYFVGSVPFGLLLTRLAGHGDIRKIGSGNIGATNVLRTGNKKVAAATLILDAGKGVVAVLIAKNYGPDIVIVAAAGVLVGHQFPVWLKFRGGKGVATALGILIAMSLPVGSLACATWLLTAFIFRYSSLSSMFAALTVFIVSSLREIANPIILSMSEKSLSTNEISSDMSFILFIFFILIIFTHRKNISNLKNKTETKIKI